MLDPPLAIAGKRRVSELSDWIDWIREYYRDHPAVA